MQHIPCKVSSLSLTVHFFLHSFFSNCLIFPSLDYMPICCLLPSVNTSPSDPNPPSPSFSRSPSLSQLIFLYTLLFHPALPPLSILFNIIPFSNTRLIQHILSSTLLIPLNYMLPRSTPPQAPITSLTPSLFSYELYIIFAIHFLSEQNILLPSQTRPFLNIIIYLPLPFYPLSHLLIIHPLSPYINTTSTNALSINHHPCSKLLHSTHLPPPPSQHRV